MNKFLTVAEGSTAALGLMLFLHSYNAGPLLAPATAPRLIDRTAAGHPSPASVTSLHAVDARASGSSFDDGPVASAIAELRRLNGMGPAAKGAIDDQTHHLRGLLTPTNVAEIARSLSRQELGSPLGTIVLERWLAMNPNAASTWIAAQPGATDHHAWLVAKALTRQSELLPAFCERLELSSWAQAFLDHSSRELLRESPVAAASLAESLTPGERQTRLFETIACDWMLRDPSSAREWIHGVADPVLRHRLVMVGAQSHASTDPLGAFEWLLAQSPAEIVLSESIRTIARLWLHTADPKTAAQINHLLAMADGRTDSTPRPE